MERLLERMAQIARMERGKLCRMGGRPHYNHQTWQDGRNAVRYVPADQADFLREAIDGYQRFMQLAEQYADEVIQQTRREREKLFPETVKPKRRTSAESASKPSSKKNET